MAVILIFYNLFLPLVLAVSKICAFFSKKISRTVKARKGIRERWGAAAAEIDRKIPLIWIHVSSVGEYLQVKPVLDILEETSERSCQVALTFYSPSGYEYFSNFEKKDKHRLITFVEYLPFDTIRNVRSCLELLRPDLIVYVRYDLWPNLVAGSARRKIPQLILSASLGSEGRDLPGIKRYYYKKLYSLMTAIASVSEDDAESFRRQLSDDVKIIATGDIRFDQVVTRLENSKISPGRIFHSMENRFLIAGSTWPGDERLVIPAFKKLLSDFSDIRLIIAPHEIDRRRLKEIEDTLDKYSVRHKRLSTISDDMETDADVIIADGLGYLAELYGAGTLAYVGGGWTTGVHNIMEPAVWGIPVFFGPRCNNAWEAARLIELGAASTVKDAADLVDRAGFFLGDPDAIREAGRKAESFIKNNTGASKACAMLIMESIRRI
ncbi:MAG: hypothetical protein JW746_09530 [Candidatus Krumholzibacteriota bacterium]|nr:hypothetical protein [Candidatus Krumholzibacteriota bacterium]